ncbi:unnamed protein product [Ectocarpus sp. CCAP 1310/34]|nr:unnamed protein product [Ectocarpus sp. CCAP 1310/34]
MAWWFLFDCLKKDSLKNMARHAGSPFKAFRALKDHFLPLSQSQIRVQEEKLKSLRMRFKRKSRNLLCIHQRDAWCAADA